MMQAMHVPRINSFADLFDQASKNEDVKHDQIKPKTESKSIEQR